MVAFISADGIAVPDVHAIMQSGNLYAYAMNNPVS